MTETILVGGAIAQKPGFGGHTWQYLQYLLGFRRLGCDVIFVDWLETPDDAGIAYLRDVMERFGLGDSWSLLCGGETIGLPRARLLDRARSSMLFNIGGYLRDEELLAAAGKRVFLDADPGFAQMWRELDLADVFAGHDVHVTIGENIGRDGCSVPTCGIDWLTTRWPVVLAEWPARDGGSGRRFTSVGAWRGPLGPVELDGERYGQRVHEFRKFVELPRRTAAEFELALAIDPGDERDVDLLAEHGWSLADPAIVTANPDAYRRYLQASDAEFMVARSMYVKTRGGWFSERSVCYLASGKPVLAQDTGLGALYPVGEGLVTFSTLDEAVAGVGEIAGSYARHAAAARELAVECFDSDKVLRRLLDAIG